MKRTVLIFAALFASLLVFAKKHNSQTDSYDYKRGVEAYENEEIYTAYKLMSDVINDDPENGYAYYWLSCIDSEMGHEGDALNWANMALEKLPAKEIDFRNRALLQRGRIYYNTGDYKLAIADFNEALRLVPDDEDAMWGMVCCNYVLKDNDNTVASLLQYVQADAGNPYGCNNAAGIAMDICRYDVAAQILENIADTDEIAADIHGKLYCCYLMLDRDKEAAAQLVKYVDRTSDLVPTNPHKINSAAYDIIVDSLMQHYEDETVCPEKWIKAMADVSKNANKFCDEMMYLRHLKKNYDDYPTDDIDDQMVVCMYSAGDYQHAYEMADSLAQVTPDSARRLYNCGANLYFLNRYDEAIESVRKAIDLDRMDFMYYRYLGKIFASAGDDLLAVDAFSTAIALDPGESSERLLRAQAYRRLGDVKNMTNDLNQIIELDSLYFNHLNAAYAYAMLGDADKAREKIAENEQKNDFHLFKAMIYTELGQYDDAIDMLQALIDTGERNIMSVKSEIELKPLHQLPRYQQMIDDWQQTIDAENHLLFIDD